AGTILRKTASAIGRFVGDKKGSIAVESAFILPIYVVVFTFSFEAVAYIKLKERSEQVIYAMADVMTSQKANVDCTFLDNLGKLGWDMFRHGNWGSTVPVTNTTNLSYDEVPIWVLATTIETKASGAEATAAATGKVDWQYNRANLTAPIVSQDNRVVIPYQYYAPNEQLFLVYGELKSTMPYNMFGLWGDEVFFKSELKYMTPRNVDKIGLGGSTFTANCSKNT
ncbi:MAG TPA: hypothetical protein VLQ68_11360, partial [Rhizobiaceae bacterium]|nr:hypothetical protein [Rhizobiaceae bacterium]